MTAKSKTPEIRFKGFTDPWEQRKFEEVFTERREKTEKELEDVLLSCAISGMYLNSELFGHFRGTTTIGYLKVKKNDLILSAQNLHLGNVNVNLRFDHGIISPAYKVYDLNDCLPEFVQAWVKKESTKKFFLDATTEGASQCRKNIEWDTLGKQTISMPVKNEQKLIGRYFSRLDSLITLHQRKHEKLVQMKKAMLDKMFPKPGEKFPEIRFKGFTDPWEQRKLGDVLTERNIQRAQSEDFPLVSFTVENGVTPKTERYDREQLVRGDRAAKKYKETRLDDIVYNPANLKFGAIARNTLRNAVFSPIYVTFNVDETAAPSFIEKVVTRSRFIQGALRYQQGTVYERMSVSPEELCDLNVTLPYLDEQQYIGSYFTNLDRLITLHQRKLELLKNIKKAMLEKMFV